MAYREPLPRDHPHGAAARGAAADLSREQRACSGTDGSALQPQLDHLKNALNHVIEEIHAVENRQVDLDRRLAQLGGHAQGLAEGQHQHACHFAAVDAAIQDLHEKASEISAGQNVSQPNNANHACQSQASETLDARVAVLERNQKAVAVSAKRALSAALVIQKQHTQADEWVARLAAQEKRITALAKEVTDLGSSMTDALAKTAQSGADVLKGAGWSPSKTAVVSDAPSVGLANGLGAPADVEGVLQRLKTQGEAVEELQEQVEEIQAGLGCIRVPSSRRGPGAGEVGVGQHETPDSPLIKAVVQSLEAQLGGEVAETKRRINGLQETIDQKILSNLWQLGRQQSESSGKVTQLNNQCQECFAKVEEHEVRLDLTRTSFEAQEQRYLNLAERVERLPSAEQVRHASVEAGRSASGGSTEELEAIAKRLNVHSEAIEEIREHLQSSMYTNAGCRSVADAVADALEAPQSEF